MRISCRKCGRQKDNPGSYCRDCKNGLERQVRAEKASGVYVSKCRKPRLSEEERKTSVKDYQKEYRQTNKERLRAAKREYRRRIREEGIKAYGGKCTCCGESRLPFLTLEHENGRNKKERRHTGYKAWAILKKQGWPPGHTVLCFQCNCAKGVYGTCPHTWEEFK